MTGFWSPLFGIARDILSIWAAALRNSAPICLRPHLQAVVSPHTIAISSLDDLASQMAAAGNGPDIVVELTDGLAMTYHFHLPGAAAKEARKAIRLEAERILPLDTKLLVIAYRVKPGVTTDGAVADIAAIRKSVSDQIFAAAKKRGLTVADVKVAPETAAETSISIPFAEITRRRVLRTGCLLMLLASAVVLAAMMPRLYLQRLEAATNDVDIAIRDSRRKTETIAGLQRQVQAMQSLAETVQVERQQGQIVDLFVQLTEASPDDIVFRDLRLDGNRLFIRGIATAPEEWVLKLQTNPAFANVILSSVTNADGKSARRFELRLDIVWPADRRLS